MTRKSNRFTVRAMERRWITVPEAAEYLACTETYVKRLCGQGVIKAGKLGPVPPVGTIDKRRWRIDKIALDEYLGSQQGVAS